MNKLVKAIAKLTDTISAKKFKTLNPEVDEIIECTLQVYEYNPNYHLFKWRNPQFNMEGMLVHDSIRKDFEVIMIKE